MTYRYAIALGSNRRHGRHGGPDRAIAAALASLGDIGSVTATSPFLRTAALGPAGRSFVNAAAILATDLAPDALLVRLKQVERSFGRRSGRRWGPRVLDLDIILWSQGSWASPGLIVPHPAFRERSFVLSPLVQVAASWRDPVTRLTVRQLAARLTARRPAPR